MLLLVPYRVDVLFPRMPWANWLLMGLCILVHLASRFVPEEVLEAFVLDGWLPLGIVGHMFLHADISHLVGNMMFLWVFGNACCARIGNGTYLVVYFLCGLMAAVTHLLIDGDPAIGASGAINGVVGLYLALYPRNEIWCAFLIIVKFGTFELSGYWLILLWFVMDIFGAITGGDRIAYWAHLGGFLSGVGCGFLLLWFRRVIFDRADLPHLFESLLPSLFKEPSVPVKTFVPVVEQPAEVFYYLHCGEQQLGPYPLATIRQLLAMSQVADTDYIFDQEAQEWKVIREFLP